MSRFERVSEEIVFQGRIIHAGNLTVRSPDGEEYQRDYMHHPGAVGVVPVTEDGSVLLVRQYRPVVGRSLLEIPAGTRDVDGEDPETTARRELIEECGMQAGSMELLCRFYNSVGVSDEETFVFIAHDLTPCADDRQGIEEQHMTVEKHFLDDLPSLMEYGEVRDAKTVVGLMMARERAGEAARDVSGWDAQA